MRSANLMGNAEVLMGETDGWAQNGREEPLPFSVEAAILADSERLCFHVFLAATPRLPLRVASSAVMPKKKTANPSRREIALKAFFCVMITGRYVKVSRPRHSTSREWTAPDKALAKSQGLML